MKVIFRITVAVAALTAAACNTLPEGSLGKTFSAQDYLSSEIAGSGFDAALAREYQKLAAYNANTEVNWIDATAYIERSKAAAGGNRPELYDPAAFGVNSDAAALRGQVLDTVGANAGARPQECAEAYAAYDFYVESLWQAPGQDPAVARATLDAALQACAGYGGMVVYFGFNRTDINADGASVIEGVVNGIAGQSKLVSLVGHTDTVGSVAYNQRLSERRATAVKDRMVSLGVPGSDITTAGRGEADLAVQTGNGVREQLNRRVVISVD